MVWAALLGSVLLFVALDRSRRLHAPIVFGLAAAATLATWSMIFRTAALGRSMASLERRDLGLHHPVALSERDLWLRGEQGLVRADLPSMRVAVMPWGERKPGVWHTVAWSGRVMFVAWHDGSEGTYGLAGRDGWIVAPRKAPEGDTQATAYWDAEARAFVMTWRSTGEPRKRMFGRLDEDGTLHDSFDVPLDLETIALTGLCRSKNEVFATTLVTTVRAPAPLGPTSAWTRVPLPRGERRDCPGSVGVGIEPTGWLLPAGPLDPAPLPSPLSSLYPRRTYDRELLLRDGSVEARENRVGVDGSTLFPIDDGYVVTRRVAADDAVARGSTHEEEMQIEWFDAAGTRVAEAFLLFPPFRWRVVSTGAGEIAIVGDGLDKVARFEKRTLRRLDAPSVRAALRDRLWRWGGPSYVYEAGMIATAALAVVLPLLAGAWVLERRRRPGATTVVIPRVAAVAAVIAIATFASTLVRYFYL
ncbi:MAG: hypothetical protein KF819_16020 [Labilithrix sp.]|nr:hypothetical protein [Labilithrix sp.]